MKLYLRFAASYFVVRLVVDWKGYFAFSVQERFGFPDVWIQVAFLILETCVVTALFGLLMKIVRRVGGRG